MLRPSLPGFLVLTLVAATAAESAKEIAIPNLTVGARLQTAATVTLSEPAPLEGLTITVTSSDPHKLLLSTSPDEAGSATITVMVRGRFRAAPEFYVQGLSQAGTATYTASTQAYVTGRGTVTLVPSAIGIAGPSGATGSFRATAGGRPSKLTVFSAAIDGAGKLIPQVLAGGGSAKVDLEVSDGAKGTLSTSSVILSSGMGNALTQFKGLVAGDTKISVSVPPGFSAAPVTYAAITAAITLPGIGLTEGITIGKDLQVAGAVSLGAPAPKGGVQLTLVSNNPEKLILSEKADQKGSSTLMVTLPENAISFTYYLQALGDSGDVTYAASIPGYRTRTAAISVSPSGVVMVGPLTLPEGQLLRPAEQGGARQQGFLTSLSAGKPTGLKIHTVQLDPVSHRAADITIQALRGGMDLTVNLKNTNPAAGSLEPQVTIHGGADHASTQFVPKAEGTMDLVVVTPPGFTQPSNDALLKVTVSK